VVNPRSGFGKSIIIIIIILEKIFAFYKADKILVLLARGDRATTLCVHNITLFVRIYIYIYICTNNIYYAYIANNNILSMRRIEKREPNNMSNDSSCARVFCTHFDGGGYSPMPQVVTSFCTRAHIRLYEYR
jgi:hypothetical protein